ncbi:MAG: hypothetical protein IKB07_05170 [Lachnospiraceae bacterium]|nr:hypothetical protein [Lachnospiraceae bacterium]
MTKNVTVTDAQGNIIGTTYPKRASGLIKNGRAIFVDDCTIRLSGKPEPSDTYNTSEVNQMNYIFFNPRNWSFDQMQNSNQNNFGYGRNNGFSQSFPAERSFINDFDGSLIESLMFGDWNTSYARAVSKELLLLPDTEYCFIFWLNGGENDTSTELCRLQISFGGNWDDCYTYKLNRNYIKPVLHKDGWELYSIPFRTPVAYASANSGFGTTSTGSVAGSAASATAQSGNSDTAPTVATHLAFVVGVAPMAVKPAKELAFYADWEDAPDEFASERPQRHNLVFADGWPSISQYGGDQYSTEALQAKKARRMAEEAGKSNSHQKTATQGTNSFHTGIDLNAVDLSKPAEVQKALSTLPDSIREQAAHLEEYSDEVFDFIDDLQARCDELRSKAETVGEQIGVTSKSFGKTVDLSVRVSVLKDELCALKDNSEPLFVRSCQADLEVLTQRMSGDAGEAYMDSLEAGLDALECQADDIEGKLDDIEEMLDSIEDAMNDEE